MLLVNMRIIYKKKKMVKERWYWNRVEAPLS